MADPKCGGPANAADAAKVATPTKVGDVIDVYVGSRPPPVSVINAVDALVLQLAMIPHYRPIEGATEKRNAAAAIGEGLNAVLHFLDALNVPVDAREPLVAALKLVAMQGRGAHRPKIDSWLVECAIQRLIDAGMQERAAVIDVSTSIANIRKPADKRGLLNRISRMWKAREPLQGHTRRDFSIPQAQKVNAEIFMRTL